MSPIIPQPSSKGDPTANPQKPPPQSPLRPRLLAALALEKQRYGAAPPVTLKAQQISGFVVTKAQLARLQSTLGLDFQLPALNDPKSPGSTLRWLAVSTKQNLYAGPHTNQLATQTLPDDPALRLLAMPASGNRRLVQSFDRSLAWLTLDTTKIKDAPAPAIAAFQQVDALGPKQRRELPSPQIQRLCAAAKQLAEQAIPYLLGGSDLEASIDCSAFVMRLFHKHSGLTLPRHSSDQRRCGAIVHDGDESPGDLLFATHRASRLSHVALIVEDRALVHACSAQGKAVHEPIAKFYESYQRRSARRIWEKP